MATNKTKRTTTAPRPVTAKRERKRFKYDPGSGDVLERDRHGWGAIYEMVDDPIEGKAIADVLNEGKGPGWDDIRDEVRRRVAAATATVSVAAPRRAKAGK